MSAHSSPFHSCLRPQRRWVDGMQHLLAWCVGLVLCLASSVMAQPVKGLVYKDFLPLGSGASVPLPEGAWQLNHIGLFNGIKVNEVYTLRNQQVDAKVPFLVVRQSTSPGVWPNTNCASKNSSSFMVNEHGTLSSQLLNKCSRVFAISNFDTWKGMSGFSENDKKWWAESVPGLVDPEGPPRRNIFQVEFTVQQHNGKRLRLDAFVLPPKVLDRDLMAIQMREGFMSTGMQTEYDILAAWNSIYIDSIHQSYFNKKPHPIMSLAYSVKSRGQTQSASATSNSPTPTLAASNTDAQASQKAQDRGTGDVLRQTAVNAAMANPAPASASLTQPVKGAVYKDFLPLGAGASVPLPEGSWLATQHTSTPRQGWGWENYTFKNLRANAQVPYLVVRQAVGALKWGNNICQSKNAHAFMVSEHGTLSSQIINKCSRYFAIDNFESWKSMSATTSSKSHSESWMEVVKGLGDASSPPMASLLLAEMRVTHFNGHGVHIEAFILPPESATAVRFRDDFKEGRKRPEQEILAAWAANYIESIQQSYFNKKPQPIMALAYPVNAVAQSPVPSADSKQALATTVSDDEALEKSHERRTQELLREMESTPRQVTKPSAISVTTTPVAPVKPPSPAGMANLTTVIKTEALATPSKPLSQPAPSLVAVSDATAQLRLDQERKAMDEEKRTMAQQLAVMTQMLAKLQQESAAAAAAAKAKEQQAAAPEPAAQPSQPVTFANRKALVIGNDLYSHVPKLTNAGADADAMARSLEFVGYKVFKHLNLSEKRFKQAVRDFRQQLNAGDEVLFFYAGHGVQLGNANYLLPIDVQGEHEDQVKDDAILLQKVLDDLDDKKTKFALAVIDACRDNPFKGKGRAIGGRGLAPTSAATGQMIMFSAGSGQQALDRLGDNDKEKNGLFTRIFVKEMVKPGLSVDRVLRNVRTEVVRLARSVGHEQTPALYDQAIGEFYFRQ